MRDKYRQLLQLLRSTSTLWLQNPIRTPNSNDDDDDVKCHKRMMKVVQQAD
ncbi:MAG: hypothetical protein MHMPM18_004522 [Marteilia pararefringens]